MDNIPANDGRVSAWAGARLNPPVEIRLRFAGRGANGFIIFAAVFLSLFLFGPPVYKIIETIYKGVPPEGIAYMLRGFACLGIWIVVGIALMAAIFVLPTVAARRHIVHWMTPEGVTTRGGFKYGWQDLKSINYQEVKWSKRGTAAVTREAMFRGSKRISIDMIFANGKAIVPPLIQDQDNILALIASIPVEQTGRPQAA